MMKDRQLRKVLEKGGFIFECGTATVLLGDYLANYRPYNFVSSKEFKDLQTKVLKIMELLDIEEVEEAKGLKKGNKKVDY